MKKILTLGCALILAQGLLVGCGNKTEAPKEENSGNSGNSSAAVYKDGTYKASYDRLDSHNWKSFVEVTVKDGKISAANFDYANDKGELKSNDAKYAETFKKVNGVTPKEVGEQLSKKVVEKQAGDVDVVTGATHSTKNFNELANAALENAKKGEAKEAVVNFYKDGVYKAEYKDFDERGWKSFVEIEVKGNAITKVTFDDINKDGKLKSEDDGYKAAMEPKEGTYPEKYTSELEKALVDKQILGNVDAVTGATSSSKSFQTLAGVCLDEMAENGEAGTKAIDRPVEKK